MSDSGSWWVVGGHDLADALRSAGLQWPTVLRPVVPDVCPDPAARGALLCTHALRVAAQSPVRSLHWLLHPHSTVIAEAAHDRQQTLILVGRVPHGEGVPAAPGAFLLGAFPTTAACARLADLAGRADDSPPVPVVLSRWLLPAGAPVPPATVAHGLRADAWARLLVRQLADAFARGQEGRA